MIKRLAQWARAIKRDALALCLAAGDRRTPWHAKGLALIVVAYAFSPIDLIPDFIPILGYLDDLLILPLGIWAAVRLIPRHIMDEHRAHAETLAQRPVSRVAAVVIIIIWVAGAGIAGWLGYAHLLAAD
jgi:uncharacterized membrane protein YkvA (DUF1232 family)